MLHTIFYWKENMAATWMPRNSENACCAQRRWLTASAGVLRYRVSRHWHPQANLIGRSGDCHVDGGIRKNAAR